MNSPIHDGQVIIIDDEEIVRESMTQTLELEGYNAIAFEDPQCALDQCSMGWQGVVICDVRMNIMDGLEVLQRILEIDPEIPVIMFSGHADIAVAIQAIRIGAYDFLEKTDDPEHHLNTVQRAWKKRQLVLENRCLRQSLQGQHEIDNRLVGQTASMLRLREMVLQLAQIDVDLVINGATGTGKEVVARCLHDFSPRAKKPFVALNCGALTESVIESELFGHEKGSFTGAHESRKGYFDSANGGTIFLDEVAELPLQTQVRLLRVLETGEYIKVGSSKVNKTDVRIVAATNVNIPKAIEDGKFREDLYYRLNTVPIELPPLRERGTDISLLFRMFALNFSEKYRMPGIELTDDARNYLIQYPFPGNIRQLKNLTEQISIIET